MASSHGDWKPKKPGRGQKVIALIVIFAMLASGAAAAIAIVLQ